ncbi:hypothetical protein [Kitasatospora sp. McL0602]|uniref:hypothetical protein n=1 Tax=Kitasatospora sp. McL0602 TaxID=3439530 RepID=UPI003F88C921
MVQSTRPSEPSHHCRVVAHARGQMIGQAGKLTSLEPTVNPDGGTMLWTRPTT